MDGNTHAARHDVDRPTSVRGSRIALYYRVHCWDKHAVFEENSPPIYFGSERISGMAPRFGDLSLFRAVGWCWQ